MSPIKHPEHYPPRAEWKRIREGILDRAGHRCECLGECGVSHRDPVGSPFSGSSQPVSWRCTEKHGKLGDRMNGKVVLTIAHLDHDASAGNHSPDNLKAYCQACHLRYDGFHRAMQRRNERERRQEQIDDQNRKYLREAMKQYGYTHTDNGDGTFTHEWKERG